MRKFRFVGEGTYLWDNPPEKNIIYDGSYVWTYGNDKGDPLSEWANEFPNEWQEVFDSEEPSKPLHKDTDLGYYAGLAMQGILAQNDLLPELVAEHSIACAKELIKQLNEETK